MSFSKNVWIKKPRSGARSPPFFRASNLLRFVAPPLLELCSFPRDNLGRQRQVLAVILHLRLAFTAQNETEELFDQGIHRRPRRLVHEERVVVDPWIGPVAGVLDAERHVGSAVFLGEIRHLITRLLVFLTAGVKRDRTGIVGGGAGNRCA